MTLALRPAGPEDAYALWLWANDPDTRLGSGNRAVIPWGNHVIWLRARLADPHTVLLVAEDGGGRPVGSIRFETHDGWARARLSYVVAPEARGQGHGRRLLEEGVAEMAGRRPALLIEAEVWPENPRSAHLFRDLGWAERVTERGTLLFERSGGTS